MLEPLPPFVPKPEDAPVSGQSPPVAVVDQKRILVIADNPDLQSIFEMILEDEGYAVACCSQGMTAQRAIRESQPDLVIMDLLLGDAWAWQTLDQLKCDPSTADLPILACSGAIAELRALERRLHQKRCEVLPKPFEITVLLDKVNSLTN
jgi:CheY-like chemotaxis protein